MIGIVIAMASLTVAVVGALLTLSLKLSGAQGDAKDLAVKLATSDEQLKASAALVASLTSDLKTANARVEAIDAENQKLRAAMPVAGSFDRLLSEAAGAAHGAGAVAVPDGAPAAAPGVDDLLDPAKS